MASFGFNGLTALMQASHCAEDILGSAYYYLIVDERGREVVEFEVSSRFEVICQKDHFTTHP